MKYNFIYCFLLACLLASCAAHKNIVYLQDLTAEYDATVRQQVYAPIQKGDWLSITVSSKNPEMSAIFNKTMSSASTINSSGTTSSRYAGYFVNENGRIDFPQLGELNVAGLTISELSEQLKKEIQKSGYLNDPVVTVQFLNFNVSVLGEVVHPGTYGTNDGRLTVLEALGKAGDLKISGNRYNIKVIREEDGVRKAEILDLRSTELFDSPYFYLHQNDIVYVEPTKARAEQSEFNNVRSVGSIVSIISLLTTLSLLIFK